MICDDSGMIKCRVSTVLIFTLLLSVPVLSADKFYDGFRNPPMSARPIIRWNWDANSLGEQEIARQLDAFKKAGFGGVEIVPGEDVNGQLFKYAADAAKQRGMIVNLSLGSTLGGPFISPAEQSHRITIGQKQFTGPTTAVVNVNDLIKVSDPNQKLMFLRLIPTGLPSFKPGEELIEKIKPDGSVAIDINDTNSYTLYAGVLHSGTNAAGVPTLDLLNNQAVEKYLNNISAKLGPAPGGSPLGNSVHSIVCPPVELSAANWTSDFAPYFSKRCGYDVNPYLPIILDDNFPKARSRFYDTIRRTRYDFYATLAELYRERFTLTFQKFCRDNGVLYCIPTGPVDILDSCSLPSDIIQGYASPDRFSRNAWNKIASSAAHLADKTIVAGEAIAGVSDNLESLKRNTDIAFVSGINQSILGCDSFMDERNLWRPSVENWTERDARLSYLFQNARHQARIAIICPADDLWSDCGPSESRMVNYFWYLFPLEHALNQNGYTVDYVSEKIFSQTTFEDGKLHFGSQTYDAVIIPDVFSMEFLTVKALRFFTENGGKIAFVGRATLTAPGFKDFLRRSVPVEITIGHIQKRDPNRVTFIPAPDKDKDNLLSWTSDLMNKISVSPTVKISPPSDKLLFVHYLAEGRDIFFFTNTDNVAPISFRADFKTAGRTPWVWNPDTGKRDKFTHSDKSGALNISIKPGDSLLLVFEPDAKTAQKGR
jgi:alpha-L-rhamnosidase